jgi:hypothetical protein
MLAVIASITLTPTYAGIVMPSLMITVGGTTFDAMDMSTWDEDVTGIINDPVMNGEGSTTTTGSMSMVNMWEFDWMVLNEADPFIKVIVDISNTTMMTQTFGVGSTTPVSPSISPSSIMDGYMTGTLKDDNKNGSGADGSASFAASSLGAIYTALVDGNPVQDLAPPGSGLSCSGAGCTTSYIIPLSFGPISGPAVNNNIGINNIFDLSAGDTVHLESYFQVTAVPVPAAVWLFGSGLLGLVGIARRKKA